MLNYTFFPKFIYMTTYRFFCTYSDILQNQLGPRCEGQLIFMEKPIPHPKRPSNTPSRSSSFFAVDGRAETDSYNFERRGHHLCTVLTRFEARGGLLPCSSYDQLLVPHVIHRQTSNAEHERKETLICADEVRLALFFSLQLLATDNSRVTITSARHEEAAACEGAVTPLSIEFWARNHAALGHIAIVVGHGRSGVSLSSIRLRQ